MPTITTGGSGNWSSTTNNAPWPGGVLPTNADDVVIAAGHTVTLDVTTAVAKSCKITGVSGGGTGGKLAASTAVDTKLVLQDKLHVEYPGGGNYNAMIDIDMSAAPTKKCELYLNAANGGTSASFLFLEAKYKLKGASRKRRTFTKAALTANSTKSVDVEDATGWRVGDILVFGTTQAYNATPRVDKVTIATITPTTGTEATVTWTDGVGTGGAVLYDHATGCMVGNFSSNLIIGPNTAGNKLGGQVSAGNAGALGNVFDNVMFKEWGTTGGAFLYNGVLVFTSNALAAVQDFKNCAFYKFEEYGYQFFQTTSKIVGTLGGHVFYSTASGSQAFGGAGITSATQSDTGSSIFQGYDGVDQNAPGSPHVDLMISGCTRRAFSLGGYDPAMSGGAIWSCNTVVYNPQAVSGVPVFTGTRIGKGPDATHAFASANNSVGVQFNGPTSVVWDSCPINTSGMTLNSGLSSVAESTYLQLLNKDNDAAVQEIYRSASDSAPVFVRDAATINRATSSMRIDIIGTANRQWSRQIPVLARAGQALKILLYVRKTTSYKTGAYSEPTATLSGLGITPVVATAGAGSDNAWELLTIDLSSGGAPSADGNLTLTLTAQSATNGAQCWFSGIPLAPFVTRCRHYGYLFDETSPTRTVNGTVSASEATAAAYTGMAVTWGTSLSTTSITLDNTFQKLYDYTQAQACLNVGSALPLTGAGVSGNPSLFAAGAITISTGKKLNGAGSISMGAYTLTTEFSDNGKSYTYTGGTWSQPSATPTFSGGTLALSGEHSTYTFDTTAATIITFAPTANAVTYGLGGNSYSGMLDLRNTHATRGITVELPSGFVDGVDYTTANNTGASITISTPTVHNYVQATVLNNTRVVLQNETTDTEIDNAFVSGTAYSFEITSEASDGDSLALYYFKEGYLEGRTPFTWGGVTQTVSVEQATDPVIQTFRTEDSITDYTTITEFNVYAPTIYIQADDADGVSKISRLATFYNGILTTEDGARWFRGGISMLSTAAVRVNKSVVELLLENVSVSKSLRFSDESTRRLYTDDGSSVIAPSSQPGSIEYAYGGVPDVVSVTSGSVITGDIDTVLAAIPSAATNASTVLAAAATAGGIAADVKKMNGQTIKGDGTEADKFRSTLVA